MAQGVAAVSRHDTRQQPAQDQRMLVLLAEIRDILKDMRDRLKAISHPWKE